MRIKLSYVADDDSVNDGADQPAQEQVSRLPLLDCESPHREPCCDPDDSVPNSSLPDTEQSQNHVGNSHKIGIIGAGIAGLYIAMILDDLAIADLTYEILEASSRVGGRLFTHHFSSDKHDYYDVGAMRYPKVPPMRRAFRLFHDTKVPLIPYYIMDRESCPRYFNGRFSAPDDADPHHVGEGNGGSVPDFVVAQSRELLEREYARYKEGLRQDFSTGIEELLKSDDVSTRQHLAHGGLRRARPKYDFFSIQWLERQSTYTGFFERAFSASVLRSYLTIGVSWWCIDGGSGVLIDAMRRRIRNQVETKKHVTAVTMARDMSEENNLSIHVQGEYQPRTGFSTVFSTTTLGALERIDLASLDLHPSQSEAIRAMHYEDATKVAIKFKYPWWIVHCGIRRGGMGMTDLPMRSCVYPSYNILDGPDGPSVLIASYTQGQDARRIASLIGASASDGEPLIDLILRDLATLHGQHVTYDMIKDAYTGEYHAYSWGNDGYASGAHASPSPSQVKNLLPFLTRPAAQGKFHIVGEASSLHHGWIVGALDSAYSAVNQFLRLYGLEDAIEHLEKRWGLSDEVESECQEKSGAH
ncbi:uncharacterized protein G6M90_00g052340 [Metarhizium brunneum]|uniref:Amine oxidase domain-containing protein n=1 Tax=Metarhizium brunneum TaxID=500148 RepID=A0A7D5UYI0_9HYPO